MTNELLARIGMLEKENEELRDKLEDCEAKGMTEYGIRNMLQERIDKAIEYLKLTMTDELLEDGSGFIRRYFKDDYRAKILLNILGDKEDE